jgi:hypothetical protein
VTRDRSWRAWGVAAAWLLAVPWLTACSSASPPSSPDANADTHLDDAAAPDATANPDAACNALSQLGEPVIPICDRGAPPAATGGAIADGTYALTESHFFGTCSQAALAETLVIAQGVVQSIATVASGEETRATIAFKVAASQTTLTETQSCPTSVIANLPFSATPTTLTIQIATQLATRVSTFTLR